MLAIVAVSGQCQGVESSERLEAKRRIILTFLFRNDGSEGKPDFLLEV